VNEPGTGPVVACSALFIRYGKKSALDGVSLEIPRGSVFALLGRNGTGKSSMIRCILGQQPPSGGSVSLLGADPWKERTRLMHRLGVVPEEPDAPPEMTPLALARFCAPLYSSWDAKGFEGRLSRFGVPAKTPFSKLSKGQKGLTMLSLALASSPELLVLDDPTLGLDPVARAAFFEEIVGELADRGTTVFLATHDLEGVERIADRVAILKEGRLALCEELELLKSRFRKIRYGREEAGEPGEAGTELDAFDCRSVKVRGWGVEAVVSNYCEEPFAALAALPGVVDAEAVPMSLEEIFLAVSGNSAAPNGGRK